MVLDYRNYDIREDSATFYKRKKFDEEIERLNEEFRFWTDMNQECQRITGKDLSTIICHI